MIANGEGVPIVALDIDGTLGDYHLHFLNFAVGWFGRAFPPPSEVNPGLKLHEFMGVSLEDYRQCKLAYRQGGLKRTMPAYPMSGPLTKLIRTTLGAHIWICTTRPYLRLDNIDPDTREWLRRNRIEYDGVLFDPLSDGNKYDELKRQAGDRVMLIADDLPEMFGYAEELFPNALVALRDQPYNQHIDPKCPKYRFADSQRLYELARVALRDWKERRGQ